MRRVREYRYIVREMMQADLERHDGIDELAFFASSYGSIKEVCRSVVGLFGRRSVGWHGTDLLEGDFFPLQFRFIRGRRKPQRRRRHGHPGITATLSGPFVYGNTGRGNGLSWTPLAVAGRGQGGRPLFRLGRFRLASCKAFPEITCMAVEKDKKSYVGAVLRTVLADLPITHVCGDVLEPTTIARGKEPNKIFCRVPRGPGIGIWPIKSAIIRP